MATFPDRLEEVRNGLTSLSEAPSDLIRVDTLMRGLHGIAGSAGMVGFHELTDLARSAEYLCLDILKSPTGASQSDREQLETMVAGLEARWKLETADVASAAPAIQKYVVLADRDEGILQELSSAIEREGVQVRTARSLAEALSLLDQELPEALLTEADLGDGPGTALLENLRARCGGDSVLAITMGENFQFLDKVRAVKAGADACLDKPVDRHAVVQLLENVWKGESTPRRILYVEDDFDQAAIVTDVLQDAGYEVVVCESPARFEEVLHAFRPELILMDILLPEISGHDLARYVRLDPANATLPILFLSTEGQMQKQIESSQAGGDDHLVKPVSPRRLLSAVASRLERARLMQRLIERDGLTGLLNRRAFERRLQEQWTRNRDGDHSCVLVILDLDHFKQVNDTYGHVTGDRVIGALAALMTANLRQTDCVARYGGEEFALLLEGMSEEVALRIVGRLLEQFRSLEQAACDGRFLSSTFSAGLAMLGSQESPMAWLREADQALYAAKEAGRNRIAAA